MTVTALFPTMIDKIIVALNGSAALTGVRVFDGAQVDQSYPGDAIAVGHDGSFGDIEMQIGNIADTPFVFTNLHEESGTINCSLWSQDGTTDIAARRTRAFAILSAVDTALRVDPTFGGTCLYSILATNSISYDQTGFGVACKINFTINYQAQS
jgi:hypothetical protein